MASATPVASATTLAQDTQTLTRRKKFKLQNKAVSIAQVRAEQHAKDYVEILIQRCEERALWTRLRNQLRENAARQGVLPPPADSKEEEREILLLRKELDMPRLLLASGKELRVHVDEKMSLHDFYQKARAELGLKANISLALLRCDRGYVESHTDTRILGCSRHVPARCHVRRQVFQVVLHP